jgi:cystathionine beta-lyase
MADSPHTIAPATRLVTAGRRAEWTGAAVNPPVWRASTHLYANCAELSAGVRHNEDGRFFYGRRGAPTQWALAEALTELEPGAAGTLLYPSGLAAIAFALMSVLRPGDELLIADNAYDPSRNLGRGWLTRLGIKARLFDPLDVAGFPGLIGPATRAVLLESPGSLTMEVADFPSLAAAARAAGAAVIADNTWATPLGFAALAHGADLAVLALTKHVGGHSDLMLGSVTAAPAFIGPLRKASQAFGQVAAPDDCALALRGLRTMGVRLERQTETALAVARWLAGRVEVARVLCPMLPGSPGHDLWTRDFTGGSGLFTFVLRGGDAAARARFVDALTLFGIGYSWGGFESLVLPVDPAHDRDVTQWPLEGMDPRDRYAVRLSIGLEDVGDLITDLERGFAAMNASR